MTLKCLLMNLPDKMQADSLENDHWKIIYKTGAIATLIVIFGTLSDKIIGTLPGGNHTELPATAIDRFAQFHDNCWLGLYYLDLLNVITLLILVSGFFALYAAHHKVNRGTA